MKIERTGEPPIIIGKRITAGAAILGIANAVAALFPDYSQFILHLVSPLTLIAQIIIVNRYGVTQ